MSFSDSREFGSWRRIRASRRCSVSSARGNSVASPPSGQGLVHSDGAISTECHFDVFVGHLQIEPFRIEVAAGPSFRVAMLFMPAFSHDLEESGIARNTANILRRPRAGAIDACRYAWCWIHREQAFELNDVLPAIAEVVLVHECEMLRSVEIDQSHFGLVEASGVAIEFGLADLLKITIAEAADEELMQMVIPPAEGSLDDVMQLAKVKGPGDDKAAPDYWFDFDERDTHLDDGGLLEQHARKYDWLGLRPE